MRAPYTQSALETGRETRIMLIDFIAEFDKVNHQEILYKLRPLYKPGMGESFWYFPIAS